MKLDDKLNTISTKITTISKFGKSQGTGFFYQELEENNNEWVKIKNLWLVTNKHVLFVNDSLPETLTFYLRSRKNSQISWYPIELKKEDLKKRIKIHKNQYVDIATIEILDIISELYKDVNNNLIPWTAVSEKDLPENTKVDIEVSDETLSIGYPKEFYDRLNLFPIIKSGIIASRWGGFFNGNPYFLIDSKLFPGSSGSLIISKPTNQIISNGELYTSNEKIFVFLGIFSGEPFLQSQPIEFEDMTIIRKESFNLGIVWYSHLIVEIIKGGEKINF